MAKAEVLGHYAGRLIASRLVRMLRAWRGIMMQRRLDLQVRMGSACRIAATARLGFCNLTFPGSGKVEADGRCIP